MMSSKVKGFLKQVEVKAKMTYPKVTMPRPMQVEVKVKMTSSNVQELLGRLR